VPTADRQVLPEHVAAGVLEAAGLPVARGRLATTSDEAVRAAHEVGFPVAIKGISAAITHRAAAGLVALDVDSPEAVARIDRALRARAASLRVTLDGTWIQHMVPGGVELLVTAFRGREWGVMVGCGMGGGATELIDDVVLARAPLDADGAFDLLGRLRTLGRLPDLLSRGQRDMAADFVARFSALVATAPWPSFTFEVNPLKVGTERVAAVNGLLVIG
jgi:acetate---CoA ligase (ADP-forming)